MIKLTLIIQPHLLCSEEASNTSYYNNKIFRNPITQNLLNLPSSINGLELERSPNNNQVRNYSSINSELRGRGRELRRSEIYKLQTFVSNNNFDAESTSSVKTVKIYQRITIDGSKKPKIQAEFDIILSDFEKTEFSVNTEITHGKPVIKDESSETKGALQRGADYFKKKLFRSKSKDPLKNSTENK